MPAAAAAFCAAEYPRLVGGLALYVGDRYIAEEIAQEALLRACRRWERVSRLDSPGGWTWRVAINLANSAFRRRAAERRAYARRPADATTHHDADSATTVAVRREVAALPERQRTAVVLRYYLDLPADECARRMGVSADAVRSLTKRGVATLRAHLGPASVPSTEGSHDA